ncbi:MAG: PIN domain-containing protein, partial [Phormidesmis sp. CAN_BIN44]|nr:PIN domain-containing protein [Phormidesmis sp. CAN_BIN44]
MSCLVDTNILLRLAAVESPMHLAALRSITVLQSQGISLCVVSQNLVEFWVAATRPISSNGLGLTIDEAIQEIRKLRILFVLNDDRPEIFPTWERLIQHYRVMGKQAHDTRLVAAMLVHNIPKILTFNVQ